MRKLTALLLLICVSATLAAPASAAGPLSYNIAAPGDPEYGTPTSIEVVHTADGGAMKNEDVSKNAALIPPPFGSPSADTPGTGEYLTPNLAPAAAVGTGAIVNGTGGNIVFPPSDIVSGSDFTGSSGSSTNSGTSGSSGSASSESLGSSIPTGYTEVTSAFYYSGGHLGTLKIPTLGLSVKIYQGTDSSTLAKGIGHFEETSIWQGNVALAAHNRGTNAYFGQIHTLNIGDTITLTTKLGTRTYEVTSVSKVSETDRSALAPATENLLTLYTCVRDQREYRWCVTATEVV